MYAHVKGVVPCMLLVVDWFSYMTSATYREQLV